MKVTKKYLYLYSPQDYENMTPAKEDVFYEVGNRTYTQFHKGDLLPTAVYEEIFGSSEGSESVERNVPRVSQAEAEGKSLSKEEIQEFNDENYAEKVVASSDTDEEDKSSKKKSVKPVVKK